MSSVSGILSFICLLRVEPFVLTFLFTFLIGSVPQGQMIQDKICIQKYNLSREFCHDLPEFKDVTNPDYHYKSLILKDATQFTLYTTIAATVPSIFWSLFFGSWSDKYVHAKKILLLLGGLSGVVQSALCIYQAVYFDIGMSQQIDSCNSNIQL